MSPQEGTRFPEYLAGQYIALRREDCKLTKKIVTADGRVEIEPDLDENGSQKIGPVTHSYSIASAPQETAQQGSLEFYVILERDEKGQPGRLTESLFRINLQIDDKIGYVDRIAGDFTLQKRAAGFPSVLLVGTGTGLAPFVSMIKQKYLEACSGKTDGVRYTLLHTNRTYQELAYHNELLKIEASGKFDFLYVPSVSRPTERDRSDPGLCLGRANNLLRWIFGMPMREEEELQEVNAASGSTTLAEAALQRAVRPAVPPRFVRDELLRRLQPSETVLLSCGNPFSMADIESVARANKIHFEKEDW